MDTSWVGADILCQLVFEEYFSHQFGTLVKKLCYMTGIDEFYPP